MAFEGKANRFAIAVLSVVRNVQAFRAEAESERMRAATIVARPPPPCIARALAAATPPFALGQFEIGLDHHFDQVLEIDPGLPSQQAPRLGGVALQQIDLGRAQVTWVGLNVLV